MRRLFVVWFMCLLLSAVPLAAQESTAEDETPAPSPMPLIDEGEYDIINIMLVGSTTNTASANVGLTDSLMVVSVNRDVNSVSIISLPRDLWVYIPDMSMMSKVNQVYYLSDQQDTDIPGMQILKNTLRYNLGLEIDYYALVDYDSFSALINSVDGIEISVDCAIQDWILKGPGLDQTDPDSWEMYTLPVGLHTLRGSKALWYVRSRRTSSDLDRGRRQQDVVRALWRKIRAQGLLQNFPALWEEINNIVVTDVTLPDALELLPLALDLSTSDVQYYTLTNGEEIINSVSEDEGRFIFEIQREPLQDLLQQALIPPTASRLGATAPTVEVINASGIYGLDQVAADRLELEGFRPIIVQDSSVGRRALNSVIDYTGQSKNNPIDTIVDVLSIEADGISVEPDPDRNYDYRVVIGNSYPSLSCTRAVQPPQPVSTEGDS